MNFFTNKDVSTEPKKNSWFHVSLAAFAATEFNECSRADSRVEVWKFSCVSGIGSVPFFRLLLVVW